MKKIMRALFFLMVCVHNFAVCEEVDFQNKLAQLSVEKTFDFFDLNLSPQDIEIVQSIIIDEANSFGKHETIAFNHYGDLDGYVEKVADFLKKFGNSSEDSLAAAQVVYKIIDNCLTLSDFPEAWIAIRVFKKNKTYHEVRWHIDESLFKTDSKYSYKLSFVLKGAHTLLCDVSDETRTEFFKIQANKSQQRLHHTTKSVRSRLADLLQGHATYQAEFGQAIMFIMGDKTIGAIHSEPAINEPRIFISIVPGSHDQIQELYNRWHVIIQGRFK